MKNNSIILQQENGQAKLIGSLNFSNVLQILGAGIHYVTTALEPSFDFTEIKKADSAGIGLMLAWWREAQHLQKKIYWYHVPKGMQALIKVGDLEKILEVSF